MPKLDGVACAHLLGLMQVSKQGFALFDETDTLCYANPVFRQRMGLNSDELPKWVDLMRNGHHKGMGTKIDTRDFERWLASAQSRRGKLPYRTIETELINGPWILTTETTLTDGWMLCVMTDVTELAQDWRDLRQERDLALKSALTDELTGLSNRRYMMNQLHHMLGPDKVASLAAVILDIDHFKRVNDNYGHDVGDLVLKHFANELVRHVRRDDFVGRMGGEEFLILMPGADLKVLESSLNRIFLAVRSAVPMPQDCSFRYACSAGVALAKPGELASELLRRADDMLYQAKKEGRDRFLIASSTGA